MNIIEELKINKNLSDEKFKLLLETDTYINELFKQADIVRKQIYGKDVYIRGLIEFTNYCKNGCYYCGINCTNKNIQRYRLTKDEILQCCKNGYALEYRTFFLHRKLALKCGANVVMPNLSPARHRSSYTLYADKIYTTEETAEKIAIAGRNTI